MVQKKILVGLSGGVDSAVSAYLLKEQGYDVSAGFMINYLTPDDSCPTRIDMAASREVADFLQIPFFTFDFIAEYEQKVLQYIFEGYAKGLTPNPDVFCNSWIKFDLFLQEALACGFDAVATGHYVRVSEQKAKSKKQKEVNNCDNSKLLRGIDSEKDQSYFLSALRPEQLSHALFPIGHLSKSEVREIAREAGLPNAERKDSQGLCFVGKVNFGDFLKSQIPPKKGPIIDALGKVVGEHDGAFQYTIGQRKGIGVGGGPALFVVDKNVMTNTIMVGPEDDPRLFRDSCVLTQMNWFVDPAFPLQCEAQIRYRQKAQKCSLEIKKKEKSNDNKEGFFINNSQPGTLNSVIDSEVAQTRGELGIITIIFEKPQRAITPGQVCVLYDGDRVLGSGIIDRV